jgi:hypothetical protein
MIGVSCTRATFERHGMFRDDLPGGEDDEFTDRVAPHHEIAWAGDVRSAHRNAPTPVELVRDHYRRGVRKAHTDVKRDGRSRTRASAVAAVRNLPSAVRWGLRIEAPRGSVHPLMSVPLMPLATGAYIAGLVAGRRGEP